MITRTILLSSALAMVAACGGSSSGSVSSIVTVPRTGAHSGADRIPSPSPSPSPSPTPASQTAARIGECVNMANMMEPPNEGDWGRAIADDDFRIIADAGFQTVRLPVKFSGHASRSGDFAIDVAFMDRVAHVVDLATAAKLRIIIDMHNYDELFTDPAAETARFASLWRQIALRFKGAPDSVWFELTNEPHDKLNDSNLRAVLDPALAAIRESNPTRKVVWGGQNYSGIDSLATVSLPGDANLITTFHYYDPFNFTHQGATWVDPSPPVGTTFGSAADRAELQRNVDKAKAFMTRTGVPVFMGEYGAYDATIPTAQRALYYKTVHDGFGDAGINGCVWGYANSFKFRDGDHWIAELLDAIGL